MKISSAVIQAVPWREPMVAYLRHHLERAGLTVTVHTDDTEPDDRSGIWPTWHRCMAHPEAHLHFEDDATLTTGFAAKAATAIGQGKFVVQFFNRHLHNPGPGHTAEPGSTFFCNAAWFVPEGYGPKLAHWAQDWHLRAGLNPNSREHEHGAGGLTKDRGGRGLDTCTAHWLQHTGQHYLQTNPSLVQHTPLPSAMGHSHVVRMSHSFLDPELDRHPWPELLDVDPAATTVPPMTPPQEWAQ